MSPKFLRKEDQTLYTTPIVENDNICKYPEKDRDMSLPIDKNCTLEYKLIPNKNLERHEFMQVNISTILLMRPLHD